MKFIVYTKDEHGEFNFLARHTDEETDKLYRQILDTKLINMTLGDKVLRLKPPYVGLAEITEDFDFILNKSREVPEVTKEDSK